MGVIGAGFAATQVHIPFLKKLPMANVLAVSDVVPERALAAASRYGIPFHTSDYLTLLQDPDIHVVDVCSPPQAHAQMVTGALVAGKHVIVEKPLAMNLTEFAAMKRTLEASSKHVGVVLNLRYMPLARSVVSALHCGDLGEVRGVSAVIHTGRPEAYWFNDPLLFRYGVLYDYVPHVIDLVLWALQAVPVSVQCMSSSLSDRSFYVVVDLFSLLVGRTSFFLDVAWTSATSIRSVQFWGSKKDLFLDLQDQFFYLARGHLTPGNRIVEMARRLTALARRALGGSMAVKYGDMVYHRELLRDFLMSFACDRCPPISLTEGFAHVAVADAAVRSHLESRAIAVPSEHSALV